MPDRPAQTSSNGPWPTRFVIQACLSIGCAVLAALTFFIPDWIERLLGMNPDGGSGELEWAIVVALAIGSATFGLRARREWRRRCIVELSTSR